MHGGSREKDCPVWTCLLLPSCPVGAGSFWNTGKKHGFRANFFPATYGHCWSGPSVTWPPAAWVQKGCPQGQSSTTTYLQPSCHPSSSWLLPSRGYLWCYLYSPTAPENWKEIASRGLFQQRKAVGERHGCSSPARPLTYPVETEYGVVACSASWILVWTASL